MQGDELFGVVEEYTALGIHRTGTPVDWATSEWVADQLARRQLDVRIEPMAFEQWTARSSLLVDGAEVEHLPVYYEFVGEVTTTAPRIEALDPMSGGLPAVLEAPTAASIAAGADALIVATDHPNGSLVAINRVPGAGSGHPTVLVAGRDLDRVRTAATIELTLRAELVKGRTATVLATNGHPGSPLVLTTPTTGWFGCAGERATGIAVLFDLVTRLDVPLSIVATSGHEIGQLGVERWVAEAHQPETRGIIHLGASVGVEQGPAGSRTLASTRLAMTDIDADRAAPVAEALRPAGLELAAATTSWIGEAGTLAALGLPMLSLSGAGIDFHTPGDLPARATSPAAMAVAADAVAEAVTHFVQTLED